MKKTILAAMLMLLSVPAFAEVQQSFTNQADGVQATELNNGSPVVSEQLYTPLYDAQHADAVNDYMLRGGGGGGGGHGGGGGGHGGGGGGGHAGGGGGHVGGGGGHGGGGHVGGGHGGGGHPGGGHPGGGHPGGGHGGGHPGGGHGGGHGGHGGHAHRGGIGHGHDRLPGGLGRHGWWWPSWGPYPGYACYSRDAAGYTFYGNNESSAMYTCDTESDVQGCFFLGCD
jgi:hypothetical protein